MAKTNGVLALGHIVEDLELLLRDALFSISASATFGQRMPTHSAGKVHLHGEDTDVLGTRLSLELAASGERDGHDCLGNVEGNGWGFEENDGERLVVVYINQKN